MSLQVSKRLDKVRDCICNHNLVHLHTICQMSCLLLLGYISKSAMHFGLVVVSCTCIRPYINISLFKNWLLLTYMNKTVCLYQYFWEKLGRSKNYLPVWHIPQAKIAKFLVFFEIACLLVKGRIKDTPYLHEINCLCYNY